MGKEQEFTGKEWDSEMGLNYFCQRYYDPEVERFMRLDPEDSPASSPYTYCMNNPLMCVDPEGTTSMVKQWVEWQMADDAEFWGSMKNYYTGWEDPNKVFYANSSLMDPDFWAPGWDWSCSNYLIRQAMFLLSSGIFEWDVLTWEGWEHINIGEWLKVQGVNIEDQYLIGKLGLTGPAVGASTMFVNLLSITEFYKGSIYDVAAVILHEATHMLQRSYGFEAYSRELLDRMERQAYSVEGFYFYDMMSSKMKESWFMGAKKYGLIP